MLKILLLEDDNTISFAIKKYLEKFKYSVKIFKTISATEGLSLNEFDLIILDVNLPDGNGFDYLKYVRSFSKISIIMLTVKNDEKYILKGFSEGADEYISKPFSLPVLKARIENVLKRTGHKTEIIFKDLTLNDDIKSAELKGKNLDLNIKEYALLKLFIAHKNENLPRDFILDNIWQNDFYEINDNTLSVTIKRLRKKLGPDYEKYLKTIRGFGYKWSELDIEESVKKWKIIKNIYF